MLRKKSIVLSDTNNTSKKAVLTLEEDTFGVKGSLRLYNFPYELSGVSSLGFYINKKVYKAGLTFKSRMFYEFFMDLKEIPSVFSCAVVNFQNANPTPILYGSSNGNNDEIYTSIISEISQEATMQNTQNILDKYGVDYDDEEKNIIEKEIDEAICDHDCANCIYKKYFFEHQESKSQPEVLQEAKIIEKSDDKIEEKQDKIQEKPEIPLFIDKLKPQIDKLFEKNPIESNLQNLIPSSKWIKVEYEDDGDFFVFGLLYSQNSDDIKYVCYGVPAVYDEDPPEELSGFPIWLPLDKNNQNGFGYWLTYQDAATGEPVKAILD